MSKYVMVMCLAGLLLVHQPGVLRADEPVSLQVSNKPLQRIVQDLANEHAIELKVVGSFGQENRDLEMTGSLSNLFQRLLKDYNHVIEYDGSGRIRAVTVISARGAPGAIDESDLPTAELMPTE